MIYWFIYWDARPLALGDSPRHSSPLGESLRGEELGKPIGQDLAEGRGSTDASVGVPTSSPVDSVNRKRFQQQYLGAS